MQFHHKERRCNKLNTKPDSITLTAEQWEEFIGLQTRHQKINKAFSKNNRSINDLEQVTYNDTLKCYEAQYCDGQWYFYHIDGGWI